jgi:hypothetical protein
MPTDTGIIFAIDEAEVVNGEEVRIEGTYNVFEGVVTSGTQISSVDYIGGDPERSYSAGALTRVYLLPASYLWNRLVSALLTEHAQDGTHLLGRPKVLTSIDDTNGNELVKVSATASAVNELTITNAATANAPQLSATGGDTNIDLKLTPKGTGRVVLNGAGAPGASNVATSETTASTSFVALATAQSFSVTVGTSGILQVTIGATLSNSGANASYVGFALSGVNSVASSDAKSIINVGTNAASFGRTFLLTGLTPGATTVTLQFRVSGGTGTFSGRELSAVAL